MSKSKLSYLLPVVLLAGCDNVEDESFGEDDIEVEERHHGGWGWTQKRVSEETPPLTCPPGRVAIGAKCFGSYCDDMTLACADIIGSGGLADRFWTGWQSSATPGDLCEFYNASLSGVACRGSYCDELSVECTRTQSYVDRYSCDWTEQFYSEESGSFYVGDGEVITGILCTGNHCDNRRYRVCNIY